LKTRTLVLCWIFFACLGIAHAQLTVGTCKSAKNPYLTISSAVAAAPASGTIQICPGTYPEQLIITKPLSLVGLTIAGHPGVTITSPAGGVIANGANYSLIDIENVPGPVNLKNLSIQNVVAKFPVPYPPFCGFISSDQLIGVLFHNTIGTVENLNIKNVILASESLIHPDYGIEPACGVGVGVYDQPSQVVTIRNSAINNVGYAGVLSTGTVVVISTSSPCLTVLTARLESPHFMET
jgi:hypothetical protein